MELGWGVGSISIPRCPRGARPMHAGRSELSQELAPASCAVTSEAGEKQNIEPIFNYAPRAFDSSRCRYAAPSHSQVTNKASKQHVGEGKQGRGRRGRRERQGRWWWRREPQPVPSGGRRPRDPDDARSRQPGPKLGDALAGRPRYDMDGVGRLERAAACAYINLFQHRTTTQSRAAASPPASRRPRAATSPAVAAAAAPAPRSKVFQGLKVQVQRQRAREERLLGGEGNGGRARGGALNKTIDRQGW